MANWKIQDIAPPKQRRVVREELVREEEPAPMKERKGKGGSFWVKAVLIPFFLVVVAGFGMLHFFFAKAQVIVWPETRDIHVTQDLVADTTVQSINIAERVIPAQTLSVTKNETRLFPASLKTVREDRASGTIRVFNAADTQPKTLVAQTRFVAEGGELFRTPERIVVPGGTQQGGKLVPGHIDVEVVGAEAGADYNIGASHFSLPGLSGSALFTAIYAESFEPMTGGSEREVSVVSSEDIERAKETLIEDVGAQARAELLRRVPSNRVADEGSIFIDVQEAISPIKPGSEIGQFNVSVQLEAVAYTFAANDVTAFIDSLLVAELEPGEVIAEGKTRSSFNQTLVSQGESSLSLVVDAVAYPRQDETELKLKLRGKSQADAQSALSLLPELKRTELSFWPFWISSVPNNIDKLLVETVID